MMLYDVRDLSVHFATQRGLVRAVRGIDFAIAPGEVHALVGESGSGKSAAALAMAGLMRLPGRVASGRFTWEGRDVTGPAGPQLVAGRDIGMVFQDPMVALNPLMTVGGQIGEPLRRHHGMSRRAAAARTAELLALVGIPRPADRLADYPHQFSGGMRQRVLIAMALAGSPKLLVADEPTTALDVTVQAQIMALLRELRARLGLAVLLITHDLGLVAALADRVTVLYGGRVAETAEAEALYEAPRHPYTAGLLRATPRLDDAMDTLWSIEGSPPDMRDDPPGCAFAPRCPRADARCIVERPLLGRAACHHPLVPA